MREGGRSRDVGRKRTYRGGGKFRGRRKVQWNQGRLRGENLERGDRKKDVEEGRKGNYMLYDGCLI